ncbi:triose-phosphate isomerase [bacterium]|nr:triose-phosphate isomerase [bacterium]
MKRTLEDISIAILANVLRFAVAATFIFSGVVKLIDPHGTEYKIEDYAAAFHLSGLLPALLPLLLSVLVSVLEFTIGVFLLFGIRLRTTFCIMTIFLSLFTPLTLYLAIANPVPDCGCFGDALVLTHWQTFCKNIILLLATLVVWMRRNSVFRMISESTQWLLSLYTWVFALCFAGYNLYRLPVIDFRPYRVGADLRTQYEEMGKARYETFFIMSKEGETREFSLDNYPDTTWTLIDTRTVVAGGEDAGLGGFQVISMETGEDLTEVILQDSGYVFLLVAPYLEKADDGVMDRILEISEYSREYGYPLYCLTASEDNQVDVWRDITGADYDFLQADATVLKTMVRSNPGLILLHDGKVVGKWPSSDLPTETLLVGALDTLPLSQSAMDNRFYDAFRIFLWYIVPLILLTLADRMGILWKRRRSNNNTLTNKKNQTTMRKKIVAGNWKMNKTLQEGVALATELKDILAADKPNCEVIIGTPFIHLATVSELLKDSVIAVSAENCANKESGAYTGEVSAAMVKSTGAEYVILGHSERREYYAETPEILKEKVDLALANGLKVIFCIGESLAQREAGEQEAVCKAELAGSVFHLTAEQWANVVIAYEPIWAIGTGKTATAEQAEEIHAYIRSCVAEVYGAEVADATSILYGGSCKASNAPELFAKPDIDGGLIGGASLKAADFKGIIDAWK